MVAKAWTSSSCAAAHWVVAQALTSSFCASADSGCFCRAFWRFRELRAQWAAFWPDMNMAPKVGPMRGAPSSSATCITSNSTWCLHNSSFGFHSKLSEARASERLSQGYSGLGKICSFGETNKTTKQRDRLSCNTIKTVLLPCTLITSPTGKSVVKLTVLADSKTTA